MEYATDQGSIKRSVTIGLIVLMHAGLVYGLHSSLGQAVFKTVSRPVEVKIISEEVIPAKDPPPPPFHVDIPPPFIPAPEVAIDLPPAPAPTIQGAAAVYGISTAAVAQPGPIRPAIRRAAKIDRKRSPGTDSYYPPISRRLNEQGLVTVQVCVAPDGRVVGQATLREGSNSDRLNEAALRYAVNTRWIAATEDGRAIESCTLLGVRFVLD